MPDTGSQTSSSTTGPPAYVQPYILGQAGKPGKPGITGVLPEAQKLYQSDTPSYYPGNTVAGFTPAQQTGLDMGINRATEGSPLNAAAGNYLTGAINGDYAKQFLGSPADSALFQSIQDKVAPAVNSMAGLTGRAGSGAHEGVMTRELTNAYAPIAAQMYGQERQLQQGAAGMAPNQAGQDYLDIGQLLGYGGQQQQQGQMDINAQVAKHDWEQNLPQQKLNQYLAAVYGFPGSTTSTKMPGQNPLNLALGGLFGGLGAAGSLGWSPFG